MSTPLCDHCGERAASVFITKVINQETTHHAYCETCAREKALGEGWLAHLTEQLGENGPQFQQAQGEPSASSLEEQMPGFFEGVNLGPELANPEITPEEQDLIPLDASGHISERCPTCGTTWDRLKKDGRAGCSVCYQEFRGQVQEVMSRLQAGPRHVGKLPVAATKRRKHLEHLRQRRDNQLALLQSRLKDAVEAERYEEAASLRDKIKMVSSTIVS